MEVRGQGALLSTATIKCAIGGTISIDDPGQKEIGVASDKQKKQKSQSKRDVDCVYKIFKIYAMKLIIKLCKVTQKNKVSNLKGRKRLMHH